ncbi:MAG: hypothetical protein CEN92_408 [Candidatus Berkelbacteria bacterium Licking1014_96]|uniref:Uncharacterized protein n=1 Tax=Candidatus Berkelbacteria bacterium Licking1014_96 TaxID=2017149 RepID=A0A554LCW3_9BACT|nr:MAG: hypothetical protein CEN92_408 [Candidatus Berkelbacteria bacterium Licking1014_96]
MGSKAALVMGVEAFTVIDLIRKAATHKGLKLQEDVSEAYSEPIRVYELCDRLLALLAEQGIKRQARPDCQEKIFTLVDENPQEKVEGWEPSNGWNFQLLEGDEYRFDLRVSLSVGFSINIEERGVVFWPRAHGSFASAADLLPNFRMFKTLAESDEDAPVVVKELAVSDGNIVITWTDLGLGGIRKLSHLFTEFVHGNETIAQLGRNGEIFDPIPEPRHQQPADELFITEPAQPRIFQAWRTQLDEYRARLTV